MTATLEQLQEPWKLRPYLMPDGTSWVSNDGGLAQPYEGKARLTKEQWARMDAIVETQFKEHAMITLAIMEKTSLEVASLPNIVLEPEIVIEDKVGEVPANVPTFKMQSLPLPISHSSFTNLEDCAEHAASVAAAVEAMLFYGNEEMQIPGLCNHPGRITTHQLNLLAPKQLEELHYYGPYLWIVPWVAKYKRTDADISTEYLENNEGLLIQLTPDVIRIVVGLAPTVVQWGDEFKVVCVMVPQLRTNHEGKLGVIHYRGNEG